jgi:hypothetical protein
MCRGRIAPSCRGARSRCRQLALSEPAHHVLGAASQVIAVRAERQTQPLGRPLLRRADSMNVCRERGPGPLTRPNALSRSTAATRIACRWAGAGGGNSGSWALTHLPCARDHGAAQRRDVVSHAGARTVRLLAAGCLLAAGLPVVAQERLVDVARSSITVHVSIDGPRPAAARTYLVDVPLSEGSVDDGPELHVQVVMDVRRARVVDPALSARERQELQERILGPDGLDATRYPRASYHSLTIDQRSAEWIVAGELELHGRILPVVATVRREGNRFRGSAIVRLSEFGIGPTRLWGGLAAVNDEIEIAFDIVLQDGTGVRS